MGRTPRRVYPENRRGRRRRRRDHLRLPGDNLGAGNRTGEGEPAEGGAGGAQRRRGGDEGGCGAGGKGGGRMMGRKCDRKPHIPLATPMIFLGGWDDS